MFSLSTLITAILATIGGIVWAIRLEGKVSQHDQLFTERKAQSDERQEAAAARHEELKQELKERLVRIESKLDTIAYGAAFAPKS
jgi:hypothetical protein